MNISKMLADKFNKPNKRVTEPVFFVECDNCDERLVMVKASNYVSSCHYFCSPQCKEEFFDIGDSE